jgi:hypothetical protein
VLPAVQYRVLKILLFIFVIFFRFSLLHLASIKLMLCSKKNKFKENLHRNLDISTAYLVKSKLITYKGANATWVVSPFYTSKIVSQLSFLFYQLILICGDSGVALNPDQFGTRTFWMDPTCARQGSGSDQKRNCTCQIRMKLVRIRNTGRPRCTR